MNINLTYDDMTRPVEGPENVLGHLRGSGSTGAGLGRSYNTLTGHVEQQAMSDVDFKNQRMSYNVLGYARNASILGGDASLTPYVGNAQAAAELKGQTVREYRPGKSEVKAMKRKRKSKGKLGVFDDPDRDDKAEGSQGEDGSEDDGQERAYMGPWAGWKDEATAPLVPEDQQDYEIIERKTNKGPLLDKSNREIGFGEEKSVFHGEQSPG